MSKSGKITIETDCEKVTYVKPSHLGMFVYYVLSITTFGIFALIMSWTRRIKYSLRYSPCDKATNYWTHLIIDTEDLNTILCPVKSKRFGSEDVKYVEFRFVRFFWDEVLNTFVQPDFLEKFTSNDILNSKPLSVQQIIVNRKLAGLNSLKTPITPVIDVLVNEILGGFNIYQIVACIIWILRDYQVYAILIIIFMIVTIIIDLVENRHAQVRLRKIAEVNGIVDIIRESTDSGLEQSQNIKSLDLKYIVPGDHLPIKIGMKAPCDIIILEGDCLVNEAVLTGESIPVAKCQLPPSDELINLGDSNLQKHIIYGGSTVIRTRGCKGYVAKVGFCTLKGQITRNILYPQRTLFKHEKESYKFLAILLAVSLLMMGAYFVYAFAIIVSPLSTYKMVFMSLDILLISIPPGLPLCLLVGVTFAVKKLRRRDITCLRPFLVNAAGRVQTVCFDKTGTLTNTSMNFTGLSISNKSSKSISNN